MQSACIVIYDDFRCNIKPRLEYVEGNLRGFIPCHNLEPVAYTVGAKYCEDSGGEGGMAIRILAAFSLCPTRCTLGRLVHCIVGFPEIGFKVHDYYYTIITRFH
jgi:hypothetical protein